MSATVEQNGYVWVKGDVSKMLTGNEDGSQWSESCFYFQILHRSKSVFGRRQPQIWTNCEVACFKNTKWYKWKKWHSFVIVSPAFCCVIQPENLAFSVNMNKPWTQMIWKKTNNVNRITAIFCVLSGNFSSVTLNPNNGVFIKYEQSVKSDVPKIPNDTNDAYGIFWFDENAWSHLGD